MPTAGEFCHAPAAIARRGEPLIDAAQRLRDENVGSLIVVDYDRVGRAIPAGVLTDRDIVVRVLARTDRQIHSILVGDVMTEKTVLAWEDDDLHDVIKRMRSYGIRRIPVVDRDGQLQGVIALDDVIEFLQEQLTDMGTLLSREMQHAEPPRP